MHSPLRGLEQHTAPTATMGVLAARVCPRGEGHPGNLCSGALGPRGSRGQRGPGRRAPPLPEPASLTALILRARPPRFLHPRQGGSGHLD